MHKGMSANKYETYNYKSMVEQCSHLDEGSKKKLLELLSLYEELFSGNIGTVPGPPVKLKLKKEARPFSSPAYTIPKAFEQIAKKEIEDLCNIGVLIKNVRTAYQSPSFFRPKKNGGVRFQIYGNSTNVYSESLIHSPILTISFGN